MKLSQAPQDVQVGGSFETSQFAVGDINFIVDMFADKVYTKKERAVIRELSCNAHDSHVMAGTTDVPFDVHIPTQLEAWFSIRDYGTGLSDEDVRNVFSGIGISTKRDSNEVIGCFGIGSLSPFAVSDSFTVTSYYNGTKSVYNCYRDDNRTPVVALLTSCDTDEPNGLEIHVPVDPEIGEKWEAEARNVFRHWSGTTANINSDWVNKELSERYYTVETEHYGFSGHYGNMYAVMGNIAYEIDDDILPYGFSGWNGYVKFELGDLSFDTARENLEVTDGNKTVIKDRLEAIQQDIVSDIHNLILSQPTDWDRMVYAERLPMRFCNIVNKYKDKDWSLAEYRVESLDKDVDSMIYYSRYGKGSARRLDLSEGVRYFHNKKGYLGRAKSFAKENSVTIFLLTQEQIDFFGVPAHLVEDPEVLPKVYRASNIKTTTNAKVFVYQDPHNRWADKQDYWAEEEVDLTGEVVFVELRNWHPESAETWKKSKCKSAGNRNIKTDFLKTCRELGIQEPTIVGLKSAFCRTSAFKNGNFIRLEDWFVREVKKVTPEGFSIPEYTKDNYRKFEHLAEGLNHEEIQEIVDSLVEWEESQGITLERVYTFMDLPVEKCTKTEDLMNNFLDKYPMVDYIGSYEAMRQKCRQAVASYINATFKEGN